MRFGIIGYGRFGKLWAGALSSCGEVLVYDKEFVDKIPVLAGMTKRATLTEVVDVDVLFLLVPISVVGDCCREIAPLLKPGVTVADACSVKTYPAKIMLELLPANQPIIATHPLFGPDSVARLGLAGRDIVVCPLRLTKKQMSLFTGLLRRMRLNIIRATPSEHDRQMARSQALVHFIGRGLSAMRLRPQAISTPDYHTLLRVNEMVVNDTYQLFLDMQQFNPFAKKTRARFLKALRILNKKL